MAIVQEMNGLLSGPEWLREQVPVSDVVQWVQAVGQLRGVDKPAVYLLGGVLDAYSWEQSAAWSWGQVRWDVQAGRLDSMLGWAEHVAGDLQRSVQSWGEVVYWVERRLEPGMADWLQWIASRQQQLSEVCVRFCQECATWCEQWQYPFPQWLQVALGLVPPVIEGIGREQHDPGRSYQE